MPTYAAASSGLDLAAVRPAEPVAAPAPGRASRHERRLIRALRQQHPDAVRRIEEDYGRVLRGYLISALRDHGDAEDVLQKVLLEAWQRGPSYDPGRGSLLTWLLMLTRSRAIDAQRKRVPVPTDPELVAAGNEALAGHDEADQLLETWRMAHLLTRLPTEEREVLRLRFYRDLTQREIAHATGIPLGTVKMRMVDGLERMRELIGEHPS